jgi:hypothetical protein
MTKDIIDTETMISRWRNNKFAPQGATITCPACGKQLKKNHSNQKFCKIRSCRDKFYDTPGVDIKKLKKGIITL